MKGTHRINRIFEHFAEKTTHFSGSTLAFVLAVLTILGWIITGPIFNYSNTWQLVINTGTTIITFLMVFLIQRAQNKDSIALHLKLNELIAAMKGASNRLIDVESLSEEDLESLHKYYQKLVERAEKEDNLTARHSIEEEHVNIGTQRKEEVKEEIGKNLERKKF